MEAATWKRQGRNKAHVCFKIFFWEIEDSEDEGSVRAVAVMSEKKEEVKDLGSRKVTRLPGQRVGREREDGPG